jgi:hypothetical protein
MDAMPDAKQKTEGTLSVQSRVGLNAANFSRQKQLASSFPS